MPRFVANRFAVPAGQDPDGGARFRRGRRCSAAPSRRRPRRAPGRRPARAPPAPASVPCGSCSPRTTARCVDALGREQLAQRGKPAAELLRRWATTATEVTPRPPTRSDRPRRVAASEGCARLPARPSRPRAKPHGTPHREPQAPDAEAHADDDVGRMVHSAVHARDATPTPMTSRPTAGEEAPPGSRVHRATDAERDSAVEDDCSRGVARREARGHRASELRLTAPLGPRAGHDERDREEHGDLEHQADDDHQCRAIRRRQTSRPTTTSATAMTGSVSSRKVANPLTESSARCDATRTTG